MVREERFYYAYTRKNDNPSKVFERKLELIKKQCQPLYPKPSEQLGYQQCWYRGNELVANTYQDLAEGPINTIQEFIKLTPVK